MSSANYQYLYRSPFNFLDPYTKEDEQIFFGRDDEIDDVFLLFEKTNLVVIYGPSGSGKSSVAQCGLVNRFYDWEPIVIRRNLNIIDSFFKAIEIETKDNIPIKGIFPKAECKKLRDIFDDLVKESGDDGNEVFYEENLKNLREVVEKLYSNLSIIPFYIFDQFEELFIENKDTKEIENFSLLLSLITRRVSYSNVVLCIQTEFFSNLVKLEDHNPNILNYKCEIKDPDEKNIRKIIHGTFEKFNINQVKDGTVEKISKKDKEERIDEIIKRLKKAGSHLPFVQIYLDKLYVLDFEDTYKKERDLLKNPKQIDPDKYPLEFKVDEIEKYGQIDEILESYINKVNTAVIATNNQIGRKGFEHTVVKFLKHFITENDTRRGIEAELRPRTNAPDIKYYLIIGDVKNEIIRSIWGTVRTDVDESIGDIINELLNARILKYRNGLLEYSHNFLVKVVKRISVDDDIVEYFRRLFNSAFDAYIISGESKKQLLSSGQVRNLNGRINEVFGKTSDESITKIEISNNVEREKKEEFWKKSKNMSLWRNVSLIGSYILIGATALIFTLRTIERKDREENEKKLIRAKLDLIKLGLNETITRAVDLGINDITQSYKLLKNLESRIEDNANLEKKEFALGLKMYDNLIQNYRSEPFYKKKIKLFSEGKREQVLSTKSRKIDANQYILFALTPERLYSTKIVLDNNEHNEKWTSISESNNQITSFEPYLVKGNIRVLYSNSKGLYDTNWEFNDSRLVKSAEDSKDVQNLKDIDHCGGIYFTALTEDSNRVLSIRQSSEKYAVGYFKMPDYIDKDNGIIALKTLDPKGERNVISYLCRQKDSLIIYRHERAQRYNVSNDTILIKDIPLRNDVLNSFKLDRDEELILFEDDRKVYSIPFTEFMDTTRTKPKIITKIITFHRSKVNSLDNSGLYTLLGSNDKTATLFYDPNLESEGGEILIKTFKGHTDAIKNVSFLGKDHVLTSSEDGTIALWDISGPEQKSVFRYYERSFIKLKFKKESLFVGFQRGPDTKAGYILELNKELTAEKNKLPVNHNGYDYTSFDFKENLIFSGLKFHRKVVQFNTNGTNMKDLIEWNEIAADKEFYIIDISVLGSGMAVATNFGLYYIPDIAKPNIKKLAPKSKNTSFNSVVIHPNGDLIIATSNDKNIYYWDIQENDFKSLPNAHVDKVRSVSISESGNYMISGSWDNTAIVWNIMEGHIIKRDTIIESHNNDIETVATALREDGHLIIATGSSDETVHLHGLNLNHSVPRLYRIPSIIRHDYAIRSVTFGENADIIYSADSRGNIKKWDISKFLKTIEDRTAK